MISVNVGNRYRVFWFATVHVEESVISLVWKNLNLTIFFFFFFCDWLQLTPEHNNKQMCGWLVKGFEFNDYDICQGYGIPLLMCNLWLLHLNMFKLMIVVDEN